MAVDPKYYFKPGQQTLNPHGRPKIPEDIKAVRKISQFEFERIVNKYLFLSPDETKEDMARDDATNFELMVGGIIQKAISKKDEKKAEWLLARTLGKMRETLSVESKSLSVKLHGSTGVLPTIEQLALENPNLTPHQVEDFAAKLERLKSEITATKNFENEIATLDVASSKVPDHDFSGDLDPAADK